MDHHLGNPNIASTRHGYLLQRPTAISNHIMQQHRLPQQHQVPVVFSSHSHLQAGPIDLTSKPIHGFRQNSLTPEPRRLNDHQYNMASTLQNPNRVLSAPPPSQVHQQSRQINQQIPIPRIHLTIDNTPNNYSMNNNPSLNYPPLFRPTTSNTLNNIKAESRPILANLLAKPTNKPKKVPQNSEIKKENKQEKVEKPVVIKKEKCVDNDITELMDEKYKHYNKRQLILNNIPISNLSSHLYNRHQENAISRASIGSINSGVETLESIRAVVQQLFDEKMINVVREFQSSLITMVLSNLKKNLNVDDDKIEQWKNNLYRNLLENSKKMFPVKNEDNGAEISDSSISDVSENPSIRARKRQLYDKKARRTVTPSPTPSVESLPKKKKKPGRPLLQKIQRKDMCLREGPLWESNNLTTASQFVMGAKANKALGYGATRGRMYIKHPEIFKYCADSDDKLWLHQQKLMPATGGRAYLIFQEDLKRIASLDEYKDLDKTEINNLQSFSVPDFMLNKMKTCMESVLSSSKKGKLSKSGTVNNTLNYNSPVNSIDDEGCSSLAEENEDDVALPFSNRSDYVSTENTTTTHK